jgi:hypothetical protein
MRTSISRSIIVALVWLCSVSLASPPAAAGTTGAFQGYVTDEAGSGIVGVRVTAASPSGDFTADTGSWGFYALNGLPLDTYTVTFSKDGYLTQSASGNTTVQDQSIRVSVRLKTSLKTLAKIVARNPTSLVQPTVTADTYVISEQRLSEILGMPQGINAPPGLTGPGTNPQVFNALPGVMPDGNGFPTIRGDSGIGFQFEGVDWGGGLLTFSGVRNVQLTTGGYDVSNGNATAGVINEVIKRGTYPGRGQVTFSIASPLYGHNISFEYGGGTPNNRFSYYLSFSGVREAAGYGNGGTYPLILGGTTFSSFNDSVINLLYHFGKENSDELQFETRISPITAAFSYLALPALAPYASNNGVVEASSDPFGFGQPSTFQSNYITFIPGQVAYQQNTNQADSETDNPAIGKLSFKRQLTPASFADLFVFESYDSTIVWDGYGCGAFCDFYRNRNSKALGEAFDYTNQLSSKHELGFGGTGTYYTNSQVQGGSSSDPFLEPLEGLGCPSLATYLAANAGLPGFPQVSTSGAGGCYIGPYNNAINNAFVARGFPNPGLPTDSAHAPLSVFVTSRGVTADPVHRWDLYVKDRWQPNQRLTVTLGLRWDKEVVEMPANAGELDATYYFDDNGNIVTLPGQSITAEVTQPQQISPRVAASYELTVRDALRFSYGTNIEFVDIAGLENTYQVPASLRNCNIANGCFIPLPGFGTTNHVNDLYQQVQLDLNTNAGLPYQPVLPQTAINLDFSYEHDFGAGLEMRLTPYYRRGSNYPVWVSTPLLVLPSGRPVYSPGRLVNGGINKSTGIEFALQRNAPFGFSGMLTATYNNTIANDGDWIAGSPAFVSGHFFHAQGVAPYNGALNLVYNTRKGLQVATTISYEAGWPYGVGKKTYVFDANGKPVHVLNTDLATWVGFAYYVTDPSNPGTVYAPNIVASRGTPEGDDPFTLYGPPTTLVNLSVSQTLGTGPNSLQVGVRAENLFANYSLPETWANTLYGFSGYGNGGLPSGVNGNACAPGQTLGCEPFRYNSVATPYERAQFGAPRAFTFFVSAKF